MLSAQWKCLCSRFVYLQLHEPSLPVRGTWWPGDPAELRRAHTTWAPRWELPLQELARTLLPLLRPTAIVVNVGHHLSLFRPLLSKHSDDKLAEMYGRMARNLREAVEPVPKVIWMTTIVNHRNYAEHSNGVQREHALVGGAHFDHVFNTSEVVDSLQKADFWDKKIHLQAHGNILLACRLMVLLHQDMIKHTGARHVCLEANRIQTQ